MVITFLDTENAYDNVPKHPVWKTIRLHNYFAHYTYSGKLTIPKFQNTNYQAELCGNLNKICFRTVLPVVLKYIYVKGNKLWSLEEYLFS